MREHTQVIEWLAIYHDLDEAERRRVDQHVRTCETCAARLATYRAADRVLARLPDPRPGAQIREDFHVAIGTSDRQPSQAVRFSQLAGRAVELAIVALLILSLGYVLRGWLQSPVNPSVVLPPTPASLSESVPSDTSPAERGVAGEVAQVDRVTGGHALDRAAPPSSVVDGSAAFVEEIPSLSPQTSFAAQTGSDDIEEGRIYVVQVDDTLWKVAEKYLGDGRRYGEIMAATHAKRAEDPSFALIADPNRITPGSKLWIPASEIPPGEVPPPAAEATRITPTTATGPGGHIAFSFWNDHPSRCTYEINIIDVAACLTSPQACQASRRIFPLNNVSEPALSPDGNRLEFRGWGQPPSEDSLYLDCAPPVNARYLANTTLDGTGLTGTGGFWEDAHPDWSPDGRQILFDSTRHADQVSRIFLINADGSDERDLRIVGQHPAWAPDGQRFVYRGCDVTGNRCGLWLAYAAPVRSWETGANLIGPVLEDGQAAHPDWSPVSAQIVYQSPKSGSWDLYIIDAESPAGFSGVRQLTSDPGIEGLPSWSPDGKWVAYLSDAGGNWGIWIIKADGSERRLLFPFDGGIFTPRAVEPYGQRDWIDEQISWSQ